MASKVFDARYRGDCAECGLWWEEGDPIRYNDGDELVHEECYEEGDPEPPQRTFTLKRDR